MRVSTKGKYALRVMIDIAKNQQNGYVSISSISERQNISNKYLEQIVSKLTKANLLIASRGQNGGYKLSKKPREYPISEILIASEGELQLVECTGEGCPLKNKCKSYLFWEGLDKVITDYARSYTLDQLL